MVNFQPEQVASFTRISIFFSQELSPEGQLIEKIAVLLRRKDLEVPQLLLKVVKAIVQENTPKGKN